MKKVNIYFTIIKIILDYFIIFGSFYLAREIRLVTDLIPNVSLPIQTISFADLSLFASIWASVLIIIFFSHWLYRFDTSWWRVKEYSRVFIYSFYAFVFFTVIVYLWQGFIFHTEIPRLIIAFTFFFWSFFLIFSRFFINLFRNFLFKKWFISKTNIFIITNKSCKNTKELVESFIDSYDYKLKAISDNNELKLSVKKKSIDKLKDFIKKRKIQEILYVNSDYSNDDIYDLWELSRIYWIKYRYVANSFDLAKSNTVMSLVNNLPTLEIQNTSLSWWNSILKRFFDIILSIFLILLFIPVFIIVSILIKLEDPKWPIIFKNKRVWRDSKEFDLYKFRYMKWKYCTKDSYDVTQEEKNNCLEYERELIWKSSTRKWPLYKIKNDPRKTKVWTFIEKYSIDELPQFFNVLLWNMSIVWPRPHQLREVDNYVTKHIILLTIKPGITGMAQVNGRESNSFEDEANLDTYYIENWSLLLDIKILFKTIYVVLTRK